ncbi:hypothetical protein BDN70DRAFT_359321 [Pholiota conissans]|uniref:F-box domain-containing protein n=1 Tax=Pholiota conissans TaxID=109636 RepID=A0A9P6D4X4_9AGAR|nr:hypothetical protein BDN70DRAFT_359321 [Pholiota conissans]
MSSTDTLTIPSSNSRLSLGSTATIVQSLHTQPILFPEIWLLVFPYLKPQDLRSVSLTCVVFRYLAQPLLFSVLDVSPFLLSYNAERPILRPRNYLERCQERLEYYKLPHIAHGVHHCWISPYTRSGFPARNQQDDLEPSLIIDTVLEALPLFPNLSTLSWHCIDITPEWWNVIQTVSIKKLWLNSSTIPLSISSPFPSITHLDLDQWPWEGRVTNHVSIHEERSLGVSEIALNHVIQPEVIQTISVPRADTARHLFSVLSQMTYGLRTLKIPFSSVTDPNFLPALEHCPTLESLCIFPPSSDERSRDAAIDSLPATTLPALTKYEGPYSHIMQFSRQPLQKIVLWGFDDSPALCDPDALVRSVSDLAETGTVDSLRSLQVTVVDITHDLLEVFAPFTRLESIIIQSQDSSPKDLPFSHFPRM